MKTISLAIAVVMPSCALAAPFLVSDPYPATNPQPTEFAVSVDGAAPVTTVPATKNADGSVILRWDVGALTGSKTMTVKARNAWGESAASAPFSFVAGVPGPAAGMRLVP